MSRRTRLTDERSALLRERDQLQGEWQPQVLPARGKSEASARSKTASSGDPEEPPKPKERVQKIDERVAEIDTELLELR